MVTLPVKTPGKKDRVDRSEKIGEVKITYYKSRHFDVDVSGQVTVGLLQRSRRALYKAASYNRISVRRGKQASIAAEKRAKLEAEAVEEANAAKAASAADEVATAEAEAKALAGLAEKNKAEEAAADLIEAKVMASAGAPLIKTEVGAEAKEEE